MREAISARAPGVIYTREWVVDLMLDMAGYLEEADLGAETLVEPGCGDGSFLRRVVPRLVRSAITHERPLDSLYSAIQAYEIDAAAADSSRQSIMDTLRSLGLPHSLSYDLAHAWIREEDFLLNPPNRHVRWVVGNPPYVRVEDTSDVYTEYRGRWATMTGRADVYIGFYEAGLSILKEGGQLCFICADRWMHNQYGSRLRKKIIEDFSVRAIVEMHETDVFDVPVAAYPAITLIERSAHTGTTLATATKEFDTLSANIFLHWFRTGRTAELVHPSVSASVLERRFRADASWPSGPPEQLRLIAKLERHFPSLSEVGVHVGVGLATGADNVFVVKEPRNVEEKFLKAAVGPSDLKDGEIVWGGRFIISPWDGRHLASLDVHPGLAAHLETHRDTLSDRYVAKRNPRTWWRTIDRPPEGQYLAPKLILADISDRIEPVLDEQGLWPLHSAYYITTSSWDIHALGGYLLSDIAGSFIRAYSVKMANGHLRVSGQYLKRIRIPQSDQLQPDEVQQFREAFMSRDRHKASVTAHDVLERLSRDVL